MIIVNAANLSSGGGYSILEEFYLYSPIQSVFLVKNYKIKERLEMTRPLGPEIAIVPSYLLTPLGILLFYFFWVNKFARKVGASEVLSLGNIASRTKIKQKVYMHWPYYAYGLSYSYPSSSKEKYSRIFRYFLINIFSRYADLWIVQTETMKKKMVKKHPDIIDNNIIYVYPGFNEIVSSKEYICQDNHSDNLFLIYPALYYSHKNFHIIKKVANLIEEKKLSVSISLTLPSKDFCALGFNDMRPVKNLGILPKDALKKQYIISDALFMPTKLETFGLPYLEAMAFKLPILTSDLDFAREICQEAAIYFDPDDADSIVSAILELKKSSKDNGLVNHKASSQLRKFGSWKKSVKAVFDA